MTANLLGINSKKPIQATVKTATMKLGVTSASPLSFAQELKTVLLTSRVEATLTLAAAQIGGIHLRYNLWTQFLKDYWHKMKASSSQEFGAIGDRRHLDFLSNPSFQKPCYTCLVEPQKGFPFVIILHNVPFLGAKDPSIKVYG